MLEAFMLKPHYGELARAAHSTFATITTIFLFSRIWARKTQYKGLWWDDYLLIAGWAALLIGNGAAASAPGYGFNMLAGTPQGWRLVFVSITFFYTAGAFSKTAFAVTLLRLSTGRAKIMLGVIIVAVWAFSIAMSVLTWVKICDTTSLAVGLEGKCIPISTLIMVHQGNAIFAICSDVVLAILPWRIISKVHIPGKEKWAVGMSMSLVGISGIVCIVRSVIGGYGHDLGNREEKVDWSYGAVVIWILMQAEVAAYIVAQAISLLRVLITSDGNTRRRSQQSSTRASVRELGKAPATAVAEEVIELVQLPSGKIVRADSEEGKAHEQSKEGRTSLDIVPVPGQSESAEASKSAQAHAPEEAKAPVTPKLAPRQADSPEEVDDETHKLWADMGLSRRAWSLSPSNDG